MRRERPTAALLPDGRRLHLQHGPIDLVLEAWGTPDQVRRAYARAVEVFQPVLAQLVAELDLLRRPLGTVDASAAGPVARRMVAACAPHRATFVTPMAAVAGAVADHILGAMVAAAALERAYVNNGGDIAVHLAPGRSLACGIVADIAHPAIDARTVLSESMPVRGIATSGRATQGQGGRSFSLGIADAVTVLASTAAAADVAATLVGNAVDLPGHPAVERRPAHEIDPDSDLGARPVTVGLGPLNAAEIARALAAGARRAEAMCRAGLIAAAFLALRGHTQVVGSPARLRAA